MIRTIFPRSWRNAIGRKRAPGLSTRANELASIDMLSHPDLARMSQTELADLPFDRNGCL